MAEKRDRTKQSFECMITRCTNKKAKTYLKYGGSGISICDRWRGKGGFKNFLADMGPRPEGKTLDRIDNKKGYSPTNCRWATPIQQAANTKIRKNKSGFKGVTPSKSGKRWAARLGTKYKVFNIGFFGTPVEAARAYDIAALLAFGDFANINFQESREAFGRFESKRGGM